ncbi:caspase-3-like [Haliotis rufescens]|uniref:caspase-3-like n=1 Tax=Haliotis rufescens TaxID=6454 RepID=UPI00201EF80A|nr:caspase-3-like [Haliotis rufescens]XP_046360748.2 caspase-3-like [Haliotis rufescens]
MDDGGLDEVDATCWTNAPVATPSSPSHNVQAAKTSSKGFGDITSGPVQYKLNRQERGLALIICNQNFSTISSRNGAEVDAKRMTDTLVSRGFDVDKVEDVTADTLQACLMSKAASDHSKRDCFICVIMTHGSEDHVTCTDGRTVHMKTLISYFAGGRCPTLIGKPKIFIINACQGDQVDEGQDVADAAVFYDREDDEDDDNESDEGLFQNLPYEVDFLYIHSTVHGYFSYRNVKSGSCFIHTLCDVMEEYGGQLEICKLLTLVNRRLAVNFKSNARQQEFDSKKQCSCFLSLLTKQLYL